MKKKYSATCSKGAFELTVDTQGWPDTEYKVKLEVTSEAGVKSSNETAIVKDILAPVVSFSTPLPTEVGNSLITQLPVDGTCESGDGPVNISAGGTVLASWPC